MNQARQQYMEILQSLDPQEAYIDPSPEQLHAICPHISEQQIDDILRSSGHIELALPPVKVRGRVQMATYVNPGSGAPYLTHIGHNAPSNLHRFVFGFQAIEYAERAWPEAMIDVSWIDTQKIILCDPTKLTTHGTPSVIGKVYVALTQYRNMLFSTHSQSHIESWNDAIHFATTNVLEGNELPGDTLNVFTEYNCAYCGGGLDVTECTGCGTQYAELSTGWDIPLAPKLVTLLEAEGHRFGLRPGRLY